MRRPSPLRSSQKRKPVMVWLEFQDCAGNTESMLRSPHPTIEDIVLETLSLEYHETIMAGYGKHAEAALKRVVDEEKGKYLVVVEGAIPTADDGIYCTIGGRTALDIAREVCGSAAATIAVGACAWDGGLVRSNPNPTGAVGLHEAVPGISIVNLPGCPHNSVNTAAVLVHYLTFGVLPALDPRGPAAVRLRPADPRSVRAPRALRRRALCADLGRRRPSQGLVPLQNGMQGSGGQLQLPDGALEWRDQLAGEVRSRLHRLRFLALLGYEITLLRDGCRIRPGLAWMSPQAKSAGPLSPVLQRRRLPTRSDTWFAIISTPATETVLPPKKPRPKSRRRRCTEMARVVIDPVTRIEGHLRIETEVNGGRVTDAWSSGTMFRGIELILRGRDPREAWIWAQRICGVCTTVHALASVRAVENALGIEIPDNARLVRNIIAGSQNVQDHVIHFYHLHALDWVDVTLALKADPAKTSQLAQSISEWPKSSATYFKGVQDRVKALVASRQLSLFSSGDWGHPAYQLPPEANLLAVAHYIEALDMQRDFIRIHAVLGGKNPHLQTYLVGGMSTAIDGNEPEAVINPERITLFNELAARAKTFVQQVYIPDVLAIASFYKEWFGYGEGLGNFMAYGDFPSGSINDPSDFFFPRGVILGRDLATVHPVDPGKIAEYVTHSWYEYSVGDQASRRPAEGETTSEVLRAETALPRPRHRRRSTPG